MKSFLQQHKLTSLLMSLCLATAWPAVAQEESSEPFFEVLSVDSHNEDDVVRVNAVFNLQFSEPLIDAVRNGVSLVLLVEIEALRERSYVWAEEVAHLEQRYEISYNALAEQYVLHNLNTGVRFKFPNFEALVAVAASLSSFPFLDSGLLAEENDYSARIRVGIDREHFPAPLRLMTYFSSEWNLSSEWQEWPLQH